MTELEIIKGLFKAFSDKEKISVILTNNDIISGIVTLFDGEKIRIDNVDLELSSIKDIRINSELESLFEDKGVDATNNIAEFISCYVKLEYKRKSGVSSTEGLVYTIKDGKLVLLSPLNKIVIDVNNIISIEKAAKPNEYDFEKNENDSSDLTGFELALLECNKDLVQDYLDNPNNLEEEGYNEKEIKKILALNVVYVPWNDDEYNILYNKARRLYAYVGNKHKLAQELFFQFINTDNPIKSKKYKAMKELIYILSYQSDDLLLSLLNEHYDYIKENDELSYYMASGLLKIGRFDEVRELAYGNHTSYDFSDIQLSLSLYENYRNYDFTSLTGEDVLTDAVGLKELNCITQLPNVKAYIQLLDLYNKKDRFESFFSLLSLSLPNSKCDERIISIVRECLSKEIDYEYIDKYLPEIPLLWFDRTLTQKYLENHVVGACETLRQRNLLGQCKRARNYEQPNEIEDAVINKKYDLLDVFTSNDSIMISYGYNSDEIIQLKNIDAIRYGNKTTIERLMILEGNRNYVPESCAGFDFLRSPLAVCQILFPILIESGNGEMIYELYNYSPFIMEQLAPLKRMYLKGLLLIGEKEEYWNEIKTDWLDYDLDEDMLSSSKQLAIEHNEPEIAEAMALYEGVPHFNNLEHALIKGDVSQLRSIVTDADYLISCGYTSEEIAQIQERSRLKIDFVSMDSLSIANRLYTFQKNKDNAAEFYYKLALKETPELAALGLFSVYAMDERYVDLCAVYEKYLINSAGTSQNKETYLYALLQTKQYKKYYDYWQQNKDEIKVDTIIQLKVLIEMSASDTEIEEILSRSNDEIKNPSLSVECIELLLQNGITDSRLGFIIKLFNLSFVEYDDNDINHLKELLHPISGKELIQPDGIGIVMLINTVNYDLLNNWYSYLVANMSGSDQISLLSRIIDVYGDNTDEFYRFISERLIDLNKKGEKIPNELNAYLMPNLKSSEEKKDWILKTLADIENVDDAIFELFTSICKEISDINSLHSMVSSPKLQITEETKVPALFYLLEEYIATKTNPKLVREVLDLISISLGEIVLSFDELSLLLNGFYYVEDYCSSYMVKYILTGWSNEFPKDTDDHSIDFDSMPNIKELTLVGVFKSLLSDERLDAIDSFISFWNHHLKISEYDISQMAEIRDYYNLPAKWSEKSVESLIIHTICKSEVPLYWRLLGIYYADESASISCNIHFHLVLSEKNLLSAVLLEAANKNLEQYAVQIMIIILSDNKPKRLNKSMEAVELVLYKYADWIANKETALLLISAIHNNVDLRTDPDVWSKLSQIALDISLISGTENEFFDMFKDDFENELVNINENLLCNLVLAEKKDSELINESLSILRDSKEIAYSKIVCDILDSANVDSLSEIDIDILTIAKDNEGAAVDESVLYRYYNSSIALGKVRVALDVLRKIKEYYPQLLIYRDIDRKEILLSAIDDDSIKRLYEYDFDTLRQNSNPAKKEDLIINMIAGETYLNHKSIEIESVFSFGMPIMPKYSLQKMQSQKENCLAVIEAYSSTDYSQLPEIVMRCSFLKRWDELMMYKLEDDNINSFIKENASIKAILSKKSFELLKSIILCIANTSSDNEKIIERALTIIESTDGLRRSKNYLRRIQNLSEEDKLLLTNVFSLDFEDKALREAGIIGASILQIPGNEKFAYLIGLLSGNALETLFDNISCQNILFGLPKDKAISIAELYGQFFYQGQDNVFSRFIAINQDENTLKVLDDNPFDSEYDRCNELRTRYLRSRDGLRSVDTPPSKLTLKKYERLKAEYLYETVIANSESDLLQINPTNMDYLSVITWLFNSKEPEDLKKYLWKVDSSILLPSFALLLVYLEQFPLAYEVITKITEEKWQAPLYVLLYRCLEFRLVVPEDRTIKQLIENIAKEDKSYYLGKYEPINNEQKIAFADKLKLLRSLMDKILAYMTWNGIECSWIEIDKDRFDMTLSYYSVNEDISPDISNSSTDLKLSVFETVNSEYIVNLLENYNTDNVSMNTESNEANWSISDCVIQLKKLVEQKRDSTDRRDVGSARDLIRWIYIKSMDQGEFSREQFNPVLELVSETDSISKLQWDHILFYLVKYFESIDSLSQLSRVVENDVGYLRNVAKAKNISIKLLRLFEIESWNNIIDVLLNIASIDFVRTPENEQIQLLSASRGKLLANSEKRKASSFEQINSLLIKLIGEAIINLQRTPEIIVEILGENNRKSQVIKWEQGNKQGSLYAVISNVGGADCSHVTVASYINMMPVREMQIDTIYSGERIPINQSFSANDLVDGKLSWYLEINYYDYENDKSLTLKKETSATVIFSTEILRRGTISTGNPAKGKNFVGRTRELTLLRSHYSDLEQLPSMLIRGLKRSGKSSILYQFSDELKAKGKIIVANVDGQSIGNDIRYAFVDKVLDSIRSGYRNNREYEDLISNKLEDFRKTWNERLNSASWIGKLDSFYYDLSQLFGKKLLIMIDEMEAIFYNNQFESIDQEETLYAALRSLIQNPENYVSFIFCGSDKLLTSCLEKRRESQMFQTLQYLDVGHMNVGDIQEIFRMQSEKYDIHYSDDAVDAIWQYTHGLVWYAKLLGYLIINNILPEEMTIRNEVNRFDVLTAVQMLINGEIGTDKYDLVDASLDTKRVAIIHAMASIMPDYNKAVSVEEICNAVKLLKDEGFINSRTGETIPDMSEKDICDNLDLLEKMQFVVSNETKTKYMYTAELYRLFFRRDKKLHTFEERGI